MKSHIRENVSKNAISSLVKTTLNEDGTKTVNFSDFALSVIYDRLDKTLKAKNWTIEKDGKWSATIFSSGGRSEKIFGTDITQIIDKANKMFRGNYND